MVRSRCHQLKTNLRIGHFRNQFQSTTAWNNVTDQLEFTYESLASYLEERIVTKRVILSTIAKIFDPLGVLLLVFIILKILFQLICKKGVDWDDPVEEEIAEQWRSILEDMKKVSVIPINRWYLSKLNNNKSKQSDIELHGFGDASGRAYGAVVYSRAESNNSVVCTLLAAKARVAPIVGSTIPRLELLSTVILARLISSIQQALK